MNMSWAAFLNELESPLSLGPLFETKSRVGRPIGNGTTPLYGNRMTRRDRQHSHVLNGEKMLLEHVERVT